jgi:hypothetical protein
MILWRGVAAAGEAMAEVAVTEEAGAEGAAAIMGTMGGVIMTEAGIAGIITFMAW